DVEEIADVEVAAHGCLAVVQFHLLHALAGQRNSPEQATRVGMDPRIEVVHLGREVYEVVPTSIEVQSHESEGTLVHIAVLADVVALHEAHVGVEKEGFCAAVRVGGRAFSPHAGSANRTVEVGDAGWLLSFAKPVEMEE